MKRPRIIICRHAESLEDIDKSIYSILKDLEIPLTENGRRQAADFGSLLGQLLNESKDVHFYTSPGVRNVQTLKIVLPKLPDTLNIYVEIEPLIVKQDWGNITAENRPGIEEERYKTGVLRYAFPTGESAASLLERLTRFKEKITTIQVQSACDIVVFSHGFEFRVLLMCFMGWSEEEFESFGNIKNCESRVLTLESGELYSLNTPLRKHGHGITRLGQSVL